MSLECLKISRVLLTEMLGKSKAFKKRTLRLIFKILKACQADDRPADIVLTNQKNVNTYLATKGYCHH